MALSDASPWAIRWAGTETSTEFFGLMEGAIRSGHRALSEILSAY
jgi:monoamine oxidase